jgi:hypothetical protein
VATEDYVREKLVQAVDALATSARPLQKRLFSAAIALSTLQAEDFVDDESRVAFGAIKEMLVRQEQVAEEGHYQATIDAMNDERAEALAQQIFDLDAHYRPPWYFVGKSIRENN